MASAVREAFVEFRAQFAYYFQVLEEGVSQIR